VTIFTRISYPGPGKNRASEEARGSQVALKAEEKISTILVISKGISSPRVLALGGIREESGFDYE